MLGGWILLAVGLFTVIGVVIFNIGMQTRKAQSLVSLVGVAGAKIIYTIVGVFCIVYGILTITGIVPFS